MKIGVLKFVSILFFSLFLLGAVVFYQRTKFYDGKLHVVFCNVGQGDGIFIRTPKGLDILVDGGPDDKILSCLSNHMPFWDRTLELVILSHPHLDHFVGLVSVVKRYTVLSFVTEKLNNKTSSYSELQKEIQKSNIPTRYVFAGDQFIINDGVALKILGPTEEFLKSSSPHELIGESKEFASLETLISYGLFSTLLTGDSQAIELSQAVNIINKSVKVLQIPHHGSKFGTDSLVIEKLNPSLAVISVGAKNRYGHPAPQVLEILRNKDIKILRTDQNGEVEIVSDGKEFGIRR